MKKKINIPICDVMFDKDYETNVKPTYVLPSSYVRHAKKVGEEADVSVDYCADQDDMVHYIAALLHESQCTGTVRYAKH